MPNFSELKRIPLREKWNHEASDFTPWLAENIQALGDALGMDLAVIDREALVGNFYLVLCQSLIEGYSFLSLIRASSVVNRQWTVVPC